jgi:hypothetical protein
MSMMRLLAAGKSLAGLKNPATRYRMGNQGALPKFGPTTAAVVSKAKEEPVSAPPAPAKPESEPAAGMAAATANSLPEPQQGALSKIVSRLLQPRGRVSSSRKPGLAKQPVQTELTLENIRVVRNDLSDTDLEVVAARPAAPAPKAASVSATSSTANVAEAQGSSDSKCPAPKPELQDVC